MGVSGLGKLMFVCDVLMMNLLDVVGCLVLLLLVMWCVCKVV